jgi:large subunit ribosomal protein L31
LRTILETGYSARLGSGPRLLGRASVYRIAIVKVPAIMKKEIHPTYREVVFQDISTDFAFLTRSTIHAKDTIQWTDGKEYPLVKVEVSSHSHPFYTGKQKIVDTAGRVDRFRRKYGLS